MSDEASIRAVLLDALDLFGLGVAPANLLALGIEVESVWYSEILVYDHASMCAVHVGALDLWRLAVPVRPEDIAVDRIEGNTARVCQVRLD